VDAVEEGRVIFAHEPLVRVQGPLLQCQLLETPLLNLINFPTLIATKAARVCEAARGDPVLEFGLRRAQGIDGGLTASRAAYVGGVSATSHLMAGKLYGIPVRGTHAHSWVMSFDDELEAFMAFAKAMPGNAVFLVDTYHTLQGVDHAIKVGQWMRTNGYKMAGIRLDSGDLAYLAREARKRLDAAGFEDAVIVASNDLDEHLIASLKAQGAPIGIWGVGTKLVTGFDDPALGGVYKMVAIRNDKSGAWQYKMKVSEQLGKITTPGQQQVRRFKDDRSFIGDMIFDELAPPNPGAWTMVDPLDMTRRKQIPAGTTYEDLLVPVFRDGSLVYHSPGIEAARARVKQDLAMLHEGIKRQTFPHTYPVGLERGLFERKAKMILELRGFDS
jgi:nicotinate phosphoribosyltransferase